MTKQDLEVCSCIVGTSENRKKYELAHMLGRMTTKDVADALAEEGLSTHTFIVDNHMRRHIPMATQEEVVEYLPSVASTCAQLLARTSTKSTTFLDKQVLEKDEIRLLGILISESGKLLDKLGSITGEAASINTPIAVHVPNDFERAAMVILPKHPEVWKEIKEEMK